MTFVPTSKGWRRASDGLGQRQLLRAAVPNSLAQGKPTPTAGRCDVPGPEHRSPVDDLLGLLEGLQKLMWRGVSRKADLQLSGLAVFQNRQGCVLDSHVLWRHPPPDHDALGDEGRESSLNPPATPVQQSVLTLHRAPIAARTVGHDVGDDRMEGHDATLAAFQPPAPRSGGRVELLGPSGLLAAIGRCHGSEFAADAAQGSVPQTRSLSLALPVAGHSRTHF